MQGSPSHGSYPGPIDTLAGQAGGDGTPSRHGTPPTPAAGTPRRRGRPPPPSARHPPAAATWSALVVVAAGGSWAEGVWRWQSDAAHLSVIGAIGAVALVALLGGRGRQLEPTMSWLRGRRAGAASSGRGRGPARAAVAGWAAIAAGVLAWDLLSTFLGTTSRPTLSKLAGELSRHSVGRGALTFVWLLLGMALALGGRRPSPGREASP